MKRRHVHQLSLSAAGALAAGTPQFVAAAPERTLPAAVAAAPDGAISVTPLPPVEPAEEFGVNEAFRALHFGALSGAGWTRWTVQWSHVQPEPAGPLNEHYFRDDRGVSLLEAQGRAGMKVAAVVISTPDWAASVPGVKLGTSVPVGLYEPVFVDVMRYPEPVVSEDLEGVEGAETGAAAEEPVGRMERIPNPDNPWGAFMYRLALEYAGLMDVFEIWNEVEIPASGPNSMYNMWSGTPAEYYRLLAVAHEAVKAANPAAKIVTAPYSYFKDEDAGRGQRLPWLDAFGAAVRAGGAPVFDAFALNLYRNPHDLWDRVHGGAPQLINRAGTVGFRQRLAAMGAAGTPLWLSEVNAMPYDDVVEGWDPRQKNDGFRITQDEQASYVLQAYATALCAGYEKVFFQSLQDDPYPVSDELWGLVRFEGEPENDDPARVRPAFVAYQLAAQFMGNAERAQLFVRTRPDPQNYKRYASRYEWAQHLATFQKGWQRAHVLWNGVNARSQVLLPAQGTAGHARLFDRYGNETFLPRMGNQLSVTLEPATRRFTLFGGDPPGYHYIGGPAVIVVEDGVPPGAPLGAPGFRTA